MEACEVEKSKMIPKLPLLNPPTIYSPERPGMKTPPLQNSASIPFDWEQEPGKPRPCTDLVTFLNPTQLKCLELPPRLLIDSNSFTKVSSPKTVLDNGPYKKDCCDSLGSMVLKKENEKKEKGLFCFWRKKDNKVKKHVFPTSSVDKVNDNVGNIIGSCKNVKMRKIKHYASFDNPFHDKSLFWTKMCEGWKRVVPWKSEKVNKYKCWL